MTRGANKLIFKRHQRETIRKTLPIPFPLRRNLKKQIASFLLPFISYFSNEWRNEILRTHAIHRTHSTNATSPSANAAPSPNTNDNQCTPVLVVKFPYALKRKLLIRCESEFTARCSSVSKSWKSINPMFWIFSGDVQRHFPFPRTSAVPCMNLVSIISVTESTWVWSSLLDAAGMTACELSCSLTACQWSQQQRPNCAYG